MSCEMKPILKDFIPCEKEFDITSQWFRKITEDANKYVTEKAIYYIKAQGYQNITKELLDSEGIYLAQLELQLSEATSFEVYKKDVAISPPFGYLIKDFQITYF